MAEAMAAGKPVIATGYSGNLAFMDERNSVLVPYRLVPIGPGHGPYPPGARWADPDIEAASAAMHRLAGDTDAARALGALAREDILRRRSAEHTARFLAARLTQIRGGQRDEDVPEISVARRPEAEGRVLDVAALGRHGSPGADQ
jgi:glycosyltransferase involved in cell wall biosynthesis